VLDTIAAEVENTDVVTIANRPPEDEEEGK